MGIDKKYWDRLNSPIAMWLIGTVLVGVATSLVEQRISARKRSEELNERFDRLGFELAGRLSQYSGWFVQFSENPDDKVNERLRPCVTPAMLRQSIVQFSQKPNAESLAKDSPSGADCSAPVRISAIFAEYGSNSTLEILAMMRLTHDELQKADDGRPLSHQRGVCQDTLPVENMSDRITVAINAVLNPDAVIPFSWKTLDGKLLSDLRGPYMCAFYGIGTDNLWYSDVFAG